MHRDFLAQHGLVRGPCLDLLCLEDVEREAAGLNITMTSAAADA
jgi:hypothetical protein